MKKTICLFLAAGIVAGSAATAQDFSSALKARQGQFRIMSHNLGILGAMAKGETPYDAATAQIAADNLVAVASVNQMVNWPEGSDNMSIDGTRALPDIWDNIDDVVSKWNAFGEAARAAQGVVGNGQEAIGPALGAIGGACKACHDKYRQPS